MKDNLSHQSGASCCAGHSGYESKLKTKVVGMSLSGSSLKTRN